jgi:phospholipid/cholesterol/gamma-HCH transport system substrate-binding protein
MPQPFKFRYVNEIAGFFVLAVILLFVAGITLAGRAQGWFEKEYHVSFTLPLEGSSGLQEGAGVEIRGTTAGSVGSIMPDAEGRMKAFLNIRREFFPYVRQDSTVIVKRQFVLVGDACVEITRGDGKPVEEDHDFGACEVGGELLGSIQELIDEAREKKLVDGVMEGSYAVRDSLLEVCELVRRFLEEYTNLAENLNDPEQPFCRLLAHVERIVARLEAGEGTAGRILTDPALADRILSLTDRVNGALDEVDIILLNVRKMSAGLPDLSQVEATLDVLHLLLEDFRKTTELLPAMLRTVDGELQEVPGIVTQVRSSLNEAEELIKSLKRHWLIRNYVEEQGLPAPISPIDIDPGGPARGSDGDEGGKP